MQAVVVAAAKIHPHILDWEKGHVCLAPAGHVSQNNAIHPFWSLGNDNTRFWGI